MPGMMGTQGGAAELPSIPQDFLGFAAFVADVKKHKPVIDKIQAWCEKTEKLVEATAKLENIDKLHARAARAAGDAEKAAAAVKGKADAMLAEARAKADNIVDRAGSEAVRITDLARADKQDLEREVASLRTEQANLGTANNVLSTEADKLRMTITGLKGTCTSLTAESERLKAEYEQRTAALKEAFGNAG